MITTLKIDIFQMQVDAIVNPVNCVGVMGKGLAKEFKERYPLYFNDYVNSCRNNIIKIGTVDSYNLHYEISNIKKNYIKENNLFEKIIEKTNEYDKKLSRDEIIEIYESSKSNIFNIFLAGTINKNNNTVILLRGNLQEITVPFSIFENFKFIPDFNNLHIDDYGYTIGFGEFESTPEYILNFVKEIQQPKYIISFPTKYHWKNPSTIGMIELGMKDFINKVKTLGIKSCAMPQLGCGLGGLNWEEVYPVVKQYLDLLPDVKWYICKL